MSMQQAELIDVEGKRWPHSGYHVKTVAVKIMRIKCSPICDGVRPFLASLKICSCTSSEDSFSHVGTERR